MLFRAIQQLEDRIVGKVYLVGAGPGDPGLLTVRGKTLLEHCDTVIYDALVSPEILNLVPTTAERIYAGKQKDRHTLPQESITQLLIDKARDRAAIVRLKGGDPFTFGRGGEELAALRAAGIDAEVIPGITAGIAVPAYAGIPVTHRQYSSSVLFVTGHEAGDKYRPQVNWQAIAAAAETIVIYMGIYHLQTIATELIVGGKTSDTPVAVIRWGTTPRQITTTTTLGEVRDRYEDLNLAPPAIAVVGRVVDLGPMLS
ncbi:MAG: uroporphyrinogen-III C-methyltransferase, partial [Cyanobacteria bacterium P01_F01_bin.33]